MQPVKRTGIRPMPVQKAFRNLVVCGVVAAAVFAAPVHADSSIVAVSESQNDGSVELSLDQTLELRLPAQLGTGSGWGLTALEGGVLRLADVRIDSQASQPGAAEMQLFVFHPVGAGSGVIALDYRRPWERDRPPERAFNLRVNIAE
jgi:inhibitor of cysteine peptidase